MTLTELKRKWADEALAYRANSEIAASPPLSTEFKNRAGLCEEFVANLAELEKHIRRVTSLFDDQVVQLILRGPL